LKRECSATSNRLPQRGQFGRFGRLWLSAEWMGVPGEAQGRDHHCGLISTNPHRTLAADVYTPRWRDRDGSMKVLWLLSGRCAEQPRSAGNAQ
jgi:hypothetical protein